MPDRLCDECHQATATHEVRYPNGKWVRVCTQGLALARSNSMPARKIPEPAERREQVTA